jgi:hypothetical protein
MWKVPKMWEGGECWIIGGGHSMPRQFGIPDNVISGVVNGDLMPDAYSPYLSAIHSKHVIGINISYLIGNWIDIVFFGDNGFYLKQQAGLAKFPGLKITCNTNSKIDNSIKKLNRISKKGISTDPHGVYWNGNSGAAAISIAALAGCKRIVLLGFDMKLDENYQHWHQLYGKKEYGEIMVRGRKKIKSTPFEKHLKGFPFIAKDAKRFGIEILNASPDSAIPDFKKVTVKELL